MLTSRRAALAAVFGLLAAAAGFADPAGAGELLAPGSPGVVREMDREELERLLQYGAAKKLTIFEVFNEAILALAARGQAVTIRSDTLMAASDRYDLGGDRVASLLPVAKVEQILLGSRRSGAKGELEILLKEEHAQFLELADIKLSRRYGFRDVQPGLFADGYGASVRRIFFSFSIEGLELYEPNKIAIHVKSLPQPKRWRIPRIMPRQAGEDRTK
jgi:hypothetical protein